MANKASFTPEEWVLLLESPMMAGMAVSAAEPSGLFGMLKESFATGKLLVQAKTDASTNALIKAVAADYETAEGRKAASEGLRARLGGGQPFWPPRRPKMPPRSRHGSRRSARAWPRLLRKAAFSASVAFR